MNHTIQPSIKKLINYHLAGLVILSSIFFLPNLSDFYLLPKTLVTILLTLSLMVTLALYFYHLKNFSFHLKAIHLPMILIIISFLLTTYLQSPNPSEAWLIRGLLLGNLSLFAILVTGLIPSDQLSRSTINSGIIIVSSLLAIFAIYQTLGVTSHSSLAWLSNKLWNPTGSPLSLILINLLGCVFTLFQILNVNSLLKKSLLVFLLIVQIISPALVVKELLIDKSALLIQLPYPAGYTIAIDGLKNWRTALLGVGTENYLAAFTKFKPATLNRNSQLWNLRFSSSSNELFNILSTTGIIGLAAWILLTIQLLRLAVINLFRTPELSIAAFIIVIYSLLFAVNPVNLIVLFTIVTALGISSRSIKTFEISYQPLKFWPVVLIILVTVLTGLFFSVKYTLADIHFRRAQQALAANKPKETLEQFLQAIRLYPRRQPYRLNHAQVNLAIATALAKKKDLNDNDKQTLVQLIQQAIQEAKASVAINPQNAAAWENLGQTYRQLINLAKGADQLAVQSYVQALLRDPQNARLWLDYGGLLLTLKQLDPALQAFRQAASLKPDYANAHYNLAAAYKADRKFALALQEMQRVTALVDPNSADYTKSLTETEELKKLVEQPNAKPNGAPAGTPQPTPTLPAADQTAPQGSQQAEDQLSTPSPAPERPEQIKEPLELPKEQTQLDQSLLTPTPNPTATPTASPTPQP